MSEAMDRLNFALDRKGCRPKNGKARCPAHDDKRASLSFDEGSDGRALVRCFAGCLFDDIIMALDLERADLAPSDNGGTGPRPVSVEPWWCSINPVPDDAPNPTPHPKLGKTSTAYTYRDGAGRLLGYVGRWDRPDGKQVRPLTFGHMSDEPSSLARWQFRSWSDPAPLFGLEELSHRLEAKVLVCEGEKAALAARDLFPDHVAVTSPGGSSRPHKAEWAPLEGRTVIGWPDNDEPGRRYTATVARLVLAAGAESAAVVDGPDTWPKGWDLADALPEGVTPADLEQMVTDAPAANGEPAPVPGDDPLIAFEALEFKPSSEVLSSVLRSFAAAASTMPSELARALARKGAIERLEDLKVKSPARLVDAALRDASPDAAIEEVNALGLIDPEPWHEPVNGVELLDGLEATFRRFVVLPDHAADALALWTVHAHAHEASMISPLLCIRSPEKGSGKTTTLDVVWALVPRPLLVANASTAAVFRSIEVCKPSLLIDEADSFLKDNEELRGILNAGHRRGGSVLRVVGDDHTPTKFSVWAPKAIALIGQLPGTLEDRSIVISMRRASADEFGKIDRFRLDRHPTELLELGRRSVRWAADNLDMLKAADPEMPSNLYGRAADNWRPLLAIGEAVGGAWPERARAAAVALAGRSDSESWGVMLLEDLKRLFERTGPGGQPIDRMFSSDIVAELGKMEDRPWPEYRRGKPISAPQLARLLGRYEISSKTIRIGENRAKGYLKTQFSDAWPRYTSSTPPVKACQRDNSIVAGIPGGSRSVTLTPDVTDQNREQLNADRQCHVVTAEKGGNPASACVDDVEVF